MQALDLVQSTGAPPAAALSPEDEAALRQAVAALERTTFAGRLTEMVGRQIDFAGKLVPPPISGAVGKAVTLALKGAPRCPLEEPLAASRRAFAGARPAQAASGAGHG